MKKIVCEMCESTEFVKEGGLFVCQGCGCKYPPEEARKLMREVEEEPEEKPKIEAEEEPQEEEPQEEKRNIPLHTPESPNKLAVTDIVTGHATIETNLIGFPEDVFKPGPDSVVGMNGIRFKLHNLGGKPIKYATVYFTPYNAVGDPVSCEARKYSTYGVTVTGPLLAGECWEGGNDNLWYNYSITEARIDRVEVQYLDNSEELYPGEEFYSQDGTKLKAALGENMGLLQVFRNQPALVTKTNKVNRLECILSNGERFEVGLMQTVSIPLPYGTYKMRFEFYGSKMGLIPAKNKETPEFVVDGDVLVELTVDAMWGGFKSKITKK
ncbi:MAG: hypothetical protein IKU11_06855 [Clostridia bacterium]|nr:hypothetical protein [Clostridia bacterium]